MSDMLLKAFDNEESAELPELRVGDNVTIHVRINVGERNERVQIVRGVVIRLRNIGTPWSLADTRAARQYRIISRVWLLFS